jgi:hypothetical protein
MDFGVDGEPTLEGVGVSPWWSESCVGGRGGANSSASKAGDSFGCFMGVDTRTGLRRLDGDVLCRFTGRGRLTVDT